MNSFWCWHRHYGFEPRAPHLSRCKHFRREFNTEADRLATFGKHLPHHDLILDIHACEFARADFVQGYWDGGYDSDATSVGVGFYVEILDRRPTTFSQWFLIAAGHGKCLGHSACCAEVKGFECLVELLNRLIRAIDEHNDKAVNSLLWEPFPPWIA